ncbi:MAG: GNAT family N-acetyltransferase [Thermoplasmata archaeon]
MRVRDATLGDAPAITTVHTSNVEHWVRTSPSSSPTELSYGELSVAERFAHGGPWMSVETCAIHLNQLLLAGQSALVVEDESGGVQGELEILTHDEVPWGRTSHFSVVYVERTHHRQGFGGALLRAGLARSRAEEAVLSTVVPALGVDGFYRRWGFDRTVARLQEVEIPVGEAQPAARGTECRPGPLPAYEHLARLPFVLGRYQSPFTQWLLWQHRLAGVTTRLRRDSGRFSGLDAYYTLEEYFLEPSMAVLQAWSADPGDLGGILDAAKHRAGTLGFRTIATAATLEGLEGLRGMEMRRASQFVFLGHDGSPADGLERPADETAEPNATVAPRSVVPDA